MKLSTKNSVVDEVKVSERLKKAPLPFTTSTLQQEASKALNFATQKTMRIAQQLYEGVDIKGSGTIGIITYLRTDSTRISDEADAAAREYIREVYGENICGRGRKARKLLRKRFRMPTRRFDRQILAGHRLLVKESSDKRSVSFVSADLEAVCSKQDGSRRNYEIYFCKNWRGSIYNFQYQLQKLFLKDLCIAYAESDEEKMARQYCL